MKIFVAFGYRNEDAWIKTMIFPILRAFGSEEITGEDLYGIDLGQGVLNRIHDSDCLIAFRTRRDPIGGSTDFTSHTWVEQEVAAGLAKNLRVLEVRETQVTPGAMVQNLQRINYDAQRREDFLIEFVKAMGVWHRDSVERPQLIPEELSKLLWKNRTTATVTYKIRRDNREGADQKAEYFAQAGAMYVVLKNVRRGDLVCVRVSAGGEMWESQFTNIDDLLIRLEKQ
jgi:hypothetical protein